MDDHNIPPAPWMVDPSAQEKPSGEHMHQHGPTGVPQTVHQPSLFPLVAHSTDQAGPMPTQVQLPPPHDDHASITPSKTRPEPTRYSMSARAAVLALKHYAHMKNDQITALTGMPTREIQRVTTRAKKRGFDGTGTFKDDYFLNGKPTGRPKKVRPSAVLGGTKVVEGSAERGGVEYGHDDGEEDAEGGDEVDSIALDPSLMDQGPPAGGEALGWGMEVVN